VSADAVVVLGGRLDRVPVGLELLARGDAPVLVVFNDGGVFEGEVDGAEVIALRPDPPTTRGEARMVGALAREREWHSLVVVSSGYHLFRARLIFRRAFKGELRMVGARSARGRLPLDVGTELLKLVYALTLRRSV